MSRDLTPDELQALSRRMQAMGCLSYEEFCEAFDRGEFRITPLPGPSERLEPEDGSEDKKTEAKKEKPPPSHPGDGAVGAN